jgi:AAHS family 3-hydroxyphenylpropionic acid transporter
MLLVARLLTGLGLGGAMPNAIAIAANAASLRRRLTVVALVTAFLPFGGAISGLLGLGMDAGWSWRLVFYVGGIVPLLLLAPLLRWLPSHESVAASSSGLGESAASPMPVAASAAAAAPPLESFAKVLFGPGRAGTTLLLWIAFFFLHMVLFLLLNWLPSLFIGLGFSRAQGSWSAFWFNICGAIAGVLLAARQGENASARARWSLTCYVGMAAALAALAFSRSFAVAALTVALSGTFVIGGQLVLYAMAPLYYPRDSRASGVGAAVTLARFGSVLGPLLAGALLAMGATSSTVLLSVLPFVAASGVAVWLLAGRRYLA